MKHLTNEELSVYYNTIPVGEVNAVTYDELQEMWNCSHRAATDILHQLSADFGDDFVIIRSSNGKGFYKTQCLSKIKRYAEEITHRAKEVFFPLKKINRLLKRDVCQYSIENNVRLVRIEKGITQKELCKRLSDLNLCGVDEPIISKIENGIIQPSLPVAKLIAEALGCNVAEILSVEENEQ